jgi:hypothetical protein
VIVRSQEVVIVLVGADKEPIYSIAFPYSCCSIAYSDSHRIKGFFRVNTLEVKAKVIGILVEKAIGSFCLVYNGTRKLDRSIR